MQALYAMQWTGPKAIYGNENQVLGTEAHTMLCEIEGGVCYEVGSAMLMHVKANAANRDAKRYGYASRYRAVPLPYAGEPCEWAQTMLRRNVSTEF